MEKFFIFSIVSAIMLARAEDRTWQIGIIVAFLIGTAIFAFVSLKAR